jgi:hypothetical protein
MINVKEAIPGRGGAVGVMGETVGAMDEITLMGNVRANGICGVTFPMMGGHVADAVEGGLVGGMLEVEQL